MIVPLSIVIPVYNVEPYIRECLDSVCSLDDCDCEVICVDDGSTDGTKEVLRDYASRHSNLKIFDQQHGGASMARNMGMEVSQGEYLFFLDSDDFVIFPQRLLSILQRAKEQKVDVCFFNALINGETLYLESMPTCDREVTGPGMMQLFYKYCRTIPTPVWMQLFRRQFLIDNHIQQKESSYHEDELFTPSALYLAQKVICLNEPIVHYRFFRQGAITTRFGEKFYNDWVNIGRDLYHFFKRQEALEEEPYRQTFGVFIQLADVLWSKGVPLRRYFSREDYCIMLSCAKTDYENKCYRLARFSPALMHSYRNNTIPSLFRKMINRWL